MGLSVFRKTLRDVRWQVFWYGLGLAILGAVVVYVYPSYREQLADLELPDAFRALIGDADYATGAGFLGAEYFSWVPVLLVIFAVTSGTSALAGEEADGTFDLLLAQPVSRARLVIEKLAGLSVGTVLICAIAYAGWLASVPFVDIDVSLGRLLVATSNLVPLTLFFVAFSMWAGAALPDRRLATGLAAALAVSSYFLNFLGGLIDALGPIRWLSVFHYSDATNVLAQGIDLGKLAVLLSLFVLFALATLLAFQRRDLGVRSGGFRLEWPRNLIPPSLRAWKE